MAQADQEAPRQRAFAFGIAASIMALGVVAIIGPEAAHVAAMQSLGLLLIAAGGLGLLSLLTLRPRAPAGAVWAWSLVAIALGGGLMAVPRHGVASLGILLGLLLLTHGGAAIAMVWRHRSARRTVFVLGALVPVLLILSGIALLFGETLGDRLEGVLIGVDMEMFAIYLVLGRELIAASSGRSPRTSSR